MMRQLKNLIKRVTSTGSTYDRGVVQVVRATFMGKKIETQVLHDYGFVSSPPSGSLGICLNPRAEENDKAAMYFHPKYSMQGLKPGETVVGNFVVEATLFFNEQGQGILTLPDDLIIQCNNLTATVNADATITVGGDATADVTGNATVNVTGDTELSTANLTANMSGNAVFTASAFTFNGPATITGPLTAAGGLAITGAVTINGVDIGENHTHAAGGYNIGGTPVTGNSGPVA